jgi:hypothetical protein
MTQFMTPWKSDSHAIGRTYVKGEPGLDEANALQTSAKSEENEAETDDIATDKLSRKYPFRERP